VRPSPDLQVVGVVATVSSASPPIIGGLSQF
jgi:hypothetical protein